MLYLHSRFREMSYTMSDFSLDHPPACLAPSPLVVQTLLSALAQTKHEIYADFNMTFK